MILDRRRFSLPSLLIAFLVGVLIFATAILIAYAGWTLALDAWIKEGEIRQQLLIDKGLIRKAPAMRQKFKTEDCVIFNNELRCTYYDKGVMKMAVTE